MERTSVPQGMKVLRFATDEQRAQARWAILTTESPNFHQTIHNRPKRILVVDEKAIPPLKEKGIKFTELS